MDNVGIGVGLCPEIRVYSQLTPKSHVPYPTIHHFGTEMYTFLFQSGVLWDMGQVYYGICVISLLNVIFFKNSDMILIMLILFVYIYMYEFYRV